VLDVGYVDGGLIGELDGVAVEVDGSNTERGTEDAARTVAGFLANYGPVDAERRRSDPVVYRGDGEIAKGSKELELRHGNFERVGDGEPLVRREGNVLAAAGAFSPVLTSETGDDRIDGFRTEREGRLSELTDERERADAARATGRSPTADPRPASVEAFGRLLRDEPLGVRRREGHHVLGREVVRAAVDAEHLADVGRDPDRRPFDGPRLGVPALPRGIVALPGRAVRSILAGR